MMYTASAPPVRTRCAAAALLLAAPIAGAQHTAFTLEAPDPEPVRQLGAAVSAVPDINDDGRWDVVVGAPDIADPLTIRPTERGRVYVFSGRSGIVLRRLDTPVPDNAFGASVSGVPDLTGDRRGDIIVGAPSEGAAMSNGESYGRVYIYSGGERYRPMLRTLQPAEPRGVFGFGRRVLGVGDLDGDRRGEVLVSASTNFGGAGSPDGRVYVYSGASGLLLHVLSSPSEQHARRFGADMSPVPDVDGDGTIDLLVGSPAEGIGNPAGFTNRVHLFSGRTGAPLRTFEPPPAPLGAAFGSSVAGVRDVTGDGRGDVVIGAPGGRLDPHPIGSGLVFVYSGATGALHRIIPPPLLYEGGEFGASVAALGDMDGGGLADIVIGAPGSGSTYQQTGHAYIFSPATGRLIRGFVSPDRQEFGGFGRSVHGLPDTDGTRRSEIIVGAPSEDPDERGESAGGAYLLKF